MSGNNTQSPAKVVQEVLDHSICPGCPGNARRAEEMLAEAGSRGGGTRSPSPPAPVPGQSPVYSEVPQYRPGPQQLRPIDVSMIERTPPWTFAQSMLGMTRIGKFAGNATSYLVAVVLFLLGFEADAATVKRRRQACTVGGGQCRLCSRPLTVTTSGDFSCVAHPDVVTTVEQARKQGTTCVMLKPLPTGLYCGGCGCKPTRAANLAIKTRMRGVKCPLGIWLKE